jgi:hypothetical protein
MVVKGSVEVCLERASGQGFSTGQVLSAQRVPGAKNLDIILADPFSIDN